MNGERLGRRFERLLFLSAPISLAAFIVLTIAFAADTAENLRMSRCYTDAAQVLEQHSEVVEQAWRDAPPITQEKYWALPYLQKLTGLMVGAGLGSDCFNQLLHKELEARYQQPPKQMITKFRSDAEALRRAPIHLSGVEIPERASFNLLGTVVIVDSLTFTAILQVVLAPVFIVWLGSLFHTRYRESILVSTAKELADIYPHVANYYQAGDRLAPRKRNWALYYVPYVALAFSAIIRMTLIALIIGPPVGAYLASLYLYHFPSYVGLYLIGGVTIAVFTLTTLATELAPWHFLKSFALPAKGRVH